MKLILNRGFTILNTDSQQTDFFCTPLVVISKNISEIQPLEVTFNWNSKNGSIGQKMARFNMF